MVKWLMLTVAKQKATEMTSTLFSPTKLLSCQTDSGPLLVPDRRVQEIDPTHSYRATNGFGYTLAVMDARGICIGWIETAELGFDSVKEWLDKRKKDG